MIKLNSPMAELQEENRALRARIAELEDALNWFKSDHESGVELLKLRTEDRDRWKDTAAAHQADCATLVDKNLALQRENSRLRDALAHAVRCADGASLCNYCHLGRVLADSQYMTNPEEAQRKR